jgi:hypothetical protein
MLHQTLALALLGATTPDGLPPLKVCADGSTLCTDAGKPFIYLADTAWELFHRLDRQQAVTYLDARAAQRFNVVQAVALAELSIAKEPNALGDFPLIDKDPTRPATTPGSDPGNPAAYDYWDHVDFIVDAANARGMYVALLPAWGRWVHDAKDRIFDETNARTFGAFVGKRYGKKAVIWILGGDRPPVGDEPIYRAMARGIVEGVAGKEDWSAVLMSMHPGDKTTSKYFHGEPWLDFNSTYSGHGRGSKARTWKVVGHDHALTPRKPVIDLEPLYEDHPIEFLAKELGYSNETHIRQRAYWAMLAGAAGHVYGNHSTWQMYAPPKTPINGPILTWQQALHRPGAAQMQHLRALFESRPFPGRVPDDRLLANALDGEDRLVALRGDGYAFVYSPGGRPFTVDTTKVAGPKARLATWWWNPRTGDAQPADSLEAKAAQPFKCPVEGTDWLLVLDDAARKFAAPGR